MEDTKTNDAETAKQKTQDVNNDNENVELQPLTENGQNNANNFDVLARDVTFKNIKIQFLRRPKSCCYKCCISVFIMLIMVLTTIPDIRTTLPREYGAEFEYMISNRSDAAQYANSPFSAAYLDNTNYDDNLAWTDNSIANEWISYIACQEVRRARAPGIYDCANNGNLQSLLQIFENKYGNSQIYQSISAYNNMTTPSIAPTLVQLHHPLFGICTSLGLIINDVLLGDIVHKYWTLAHLLLVILCFATHIRCLLRFIVCNFITWNLPQNRTHIIYYIILALWKHIALFLSSFLVLTTLFLALGASLLLRHCTLFTININKKRFDGTRIFNSIYNKYIFFDAYSIQNHSYNKYYNYIIIAICI